MEHCSVLKSILQDSYIGNENHSYSEVGDISIQISIDATAVNGKLSTRKLDDLDEKYRVLYGLRPISIRDGKNIGYNWST